VHKMLVKMTPDRLVSDKSTGDKYKDKTCYNSVIAIRVNRKNARKNNINLKDLLLATGNTFEQGLHWYRHMD
jgi:hypothetical protein